MQLNNRLPQKAELSETEVDDRIENVITSRRTIHKFLPLPVPELEIRNAIDVARWAPNHKLTEPWKFYLLGEKSVEHLIDLNIQIFLSDKSAEYRANNRDKWLSKPSTTLVTSKVSANPLRRREDYAATCCAIHNFMLYLWSVGIGTKWSTTGLTRRPELYQALGINPQREEVVGLLWAGYPEVIPEQHRKSTQQICIEKA